MGLLPGLAEFILANERIIFYNVNEYSFRDKGGQLIGSQ